MPSRAAEHAARAGALEGESVRQLLARARARAESERPAEASAATERALALQPSDPDARALLAKLRKREAAGEPWLARLGRAWRARRSR
jgi:hypothetical protein